MKLGVILILISLFTNVSEGNAFPTKKYARINQLNVGLDLSQFNYFVGPNKKGFNGSAMAQYKPYYFLGFSASCFYNNVRFQRDQGYRDLLEYDCSGIGTKLGTELSLSLSRKKRDNRMFLGYQVAFVQFRESGLFVKQEQYWGNYYHGFNSKSKQFVANEIIGGFQFSKGKFKIRTQFYGIFFADDSRVSYDHDIIQGYRSPFLPGYGFKRGGLNLFLLYSFWLGND